VLLPYEHRLEADATRDRLEAYATIVEEAMDLNKFTEKSQAALTLSFGRGPVSRIPSARLVPSFFSSRSRFGKGSNEQGI
jgi:hypothetical protein